MSLSDRIDAKRDDLVALTQELIRIPTLNPPGQHDYDIFTGLEARPKTHNFETQTIHTFGILGIATLVRTEVCLPAASAEMQASACISAAITTWLRLAQDGHATHLAPKSKAINSMVVGPAT